MMWGWVVISSSWLRAPILGEEGQTIPLRRSLPCAGLGKRSWALANAATQGSNVKTTMAGHSDGVRCVRMD
jgi:hypothetical protein